MIKINLLPSHVAEGRKARRLLRLVILVLLVECALCGYYFTSLNSTITAKTAELAAATQRADQVRALQQQVVATKAATEPVQGKLDWYNAIYAGPKALAKDLKRINDYIYAKLTVKSLSYYGNNVDLQTVTKGSEQDLTNLSIAYLNFLRSPYIDPASVQFNPSFQVSSQTAGARGVGRGRSRGGFESGSRGGRRGNRGRGRMMGEENMAAPGSGMIAAAPAPNPNETMSISFTFSLKPQAGAGADASALSGGEGGGGRMGRLGGRTGGRMGRLGGGMGGRLGGGMGGRMGVRGGG